MLYLFLDVQLNKSEMAESMTTSSTYLALLCLAPHSPRYLQLLEPGSIPSRVALSRSSFNDRPGHWAEIL